MTLHFDGTPLEFFDQSGYVVFDIYMKHMKKDFSNLKIFEEINQMIEDAMQVAEDALLEIEPRLAFRVPLKPWWNQANEKEWVLFKCTPPYKIFGLPDITHIVIKQSKNMKYDLYSATSNGAILSNLKNGFQGYTEIFDELGYSFFDLKSFSTTNKFFLLEKQL